MSATAHLSDLAEINKARALSHPMYMLGLATFSWEGAVRILHRTLLEVVAIAVTERTLNGKPLPISFFAPLCPVYAYIFYIA